ncbi:MAG: putative maltokinase, partial [Gammaproteobacteria bacterium]|nr:putative maltokinase [Gammaproteobacteria bacterium]
LSEEAAVPAWHAEMLPPLELPVLVLTDEWRTFFPEAVGGTRRAVAEKLVRQLESEILPAYLSKQRWFSAKGETMDEARLGERICWQHEGGSWLIGWVRVRAGGRSERYFMPLSLIWSEDDERIRPLLSRALAKVRQRQHPGLLCDALADESFARALVRAMGAGESSSFGDGRLRFSSTSAFARLMRDAPDDWSARPPSAEGSNSALLVGERLFLKVYRRLREGINPEIEMGRFLTDVSPVDNVAALAGVLEYEGDDGERIALAVLQERVIAQGDAWSYTVDYLRRFAEEALLESASAQIREGQSRVDNPDTQARHDGYLSMMRTLGRRTGELHCALSVTSGDPAFDPEPITREDLRAWTGRTAEEAKLTFDKLERQLEGLPETARGQAERLLASRGALDRRIGSLAPARVQGAKTRYHGDYHLGQVLVAENDFVIVDFEGEPARPLAERKAKSSALKDVAGMLRSFSYAATTALREATADRPDDVRVLRPLLHDWERAARSAFEGAYAEAIAGCEAVPESAEERDALVALFSLEKALYELRYELDNRPEWATIPLGGLLELADAASA